MKLEPEVAAQKHGMAEDHVIADRPGHYQQKAERGRIDCLLRSVGTFSCEESVTVGKRQNAQKSGIRECRDAPENAKEHPVFGSTSFRRAEGDVQDRCKQQRAGCEVPDPRCGPAEEDRAYRPDPCGPHSYFGTERPAAQPVNRNPRGCRHETLQSEQKERRGTGVNAEQPEDKGDDARIDWRNPRSWPGIVQERGAEALSARQVSGDARDLERVGIDRSRTLYVSLGPEHESKTQGKADAQYQPIELPMRFRWGWGLYGGNRHHSSVGEARCEINGQRGQGSPEEQQAGF